MTKMNTIIENKGWVIMLKEPLLFYKNNDGIKFYLVNCGAGLTHLIIFPNNIVMLFDCNLIQDEEHPNRNKDYILNFFKNVIPKKQDGYGNIFQPIDIFVNSHRDTDHLKGLKDINSMFPIQSIWDSGFHGANIDNADYKYYMGLRNRLKNKNKLNLRVPEPSNSLFESIGGADIYCLCDAQEYVAREDGVLYESADKNQHTNCMVLLIHYAQRKILLTGDSDWKAWKEDIIPNFKDCSVNYENTDILIASHHGSKTFFTREDTINIEKYPDTTYIESIKLINPKITLISCAEYEYKGYHLPNKEAKKLYEEYTSNAQVYTTNEFGTFFGRIDSEGNFSVTPERFYNRGGQIGKWVKIICKTDTGNIIENNTSYNVNCKLKFNLVSIGGVLDDIDKPQVWREVCNAGYEKDDTHHDIYYKGRDEEDGKYSFSRDLAFVGTHLLRCHVMNKKKKFDQTVIFVIHGK